MNNILRSHVECTKKNPNHWPVQSNFFYMITAHLLWDVWLFAFYFHTKKMIGLIKK